MSSSFESSPRPTKKRKIADQADENTEIPILKRALRTVKQALNINKDTFSVKDGGKRTPGKAAEEDLGSALRLRWRGKGGAKLRDGKGDGLQKDSVADKNGVEEEEEGEGRMTAGRRKGNRHQLDGDVETAPKGDGHCRATSSKRRSTAPSLRHATPESAIKANDSSGETRQPTSTGKRKRVKGWTYIADEDELGQEDVQEDQGDDDQAIGRVKRGREDLRIDMNLSQLKPKRSVPSTNGAIAGAEEPKATEDSKKRRTSRRVETKAETAMVEGHVATPRSKKKKGKQKKTIRKTSPSVDGDDQQDEIPQIRGSRDASTDELAYDFPGGESDQEQVMQTPTRKPQRIVRKISQRTPDGEDQFSEEISEPDSHQEMALDAQLSTNDHTQALQQIFEQDPDSLNNLKTHLLSGLTGKRRLPLVKLDDEHQKVSQLLEQTVLAGEGNSMLIIGSRGSGKTTLVESVVSELASDHRDQFHVVRLNGFVHTDDKLALREIWRQLGREMEVENDDLGGRSNYADTLTSLLALLAHSAEDSEEQPAAAAKSVIFILDEFDLFAAHPRQTLLYNLFDVAQSRNAPIAVLGLTTKFNVIDSLEKRVKSRFSQRYIHLSLPKTFTTFQSICLSALSYNPSTHDLLRPSKPSLHHLSTTWNSYITSLSSSPQFNHHLQTLYTTTKSIPAFLTSALLPISTLTPTTLPTPTSFTSTLYPPDSKLHLLPTLSTLSLSLLISAARLDIILDTDVATFDMVYEEYVALASKSKLQSSAAGQMAVGAGGGGRVWSGDLARGSWEGLGRLGLVVPATGGESGRGGKGEMWKVDVGLEEIGGWLEGVSGRGGALGKWCREI